MVSLCLFTGRGGCRLAAEARAEGERRYALDDFVVAQRGDLCVGHAEPVLERFAAVLAEERRRFHRGLECR